MPSSDIDFASVTSVLADLIIFVTKDDIIDPKVRVGQPMPNPYYVLLTIYC